MDTPLAVATWALVVATVLLAVVAFLQWRQMKTASGEDKRQSETFERQAALLADSLDVSRQMLAEAKADRESALPFSIALELTSESVAGVASLRFRNAQPGVVLQLKHVQIFESPGETFAFDQTLAEGTLGAGDGEQWTISFPYDATRIGATYHVHATGRRLGGPEMTVPFAYRIGQDGRLIDLAAGPGPGFSFA